MEYIKSLILILISYLFMHLFIQPMMGDLMIGLSSLLLLASLSQIAGISGIASGVLVPARETQDGAWPTSRGWL